MLTYLVVHGYWGSLSQQSIGRRSTWLPILLDWLPRTNRVSDHEGNGLSDSLAIIVSAGASCIFTHILITRWLKRDTRGLPRPFKLHGSKAVGLFWILLASTSSESSHRWEIFVTTQISIFKHDICMLSNVTIFRDTIKKGLNRYRPVSGTLPSVDEWLFCLYKNGSLLDRKH